MIKIIKFLYIATGLLILCILSNACYDPRFGPLNCEELYEEYEDSGWRPCQPIEVTKKNSFKLTVKDKITGDPVEGIYVLIILHFTQTRPTDQCPPLCWITSYWIGAEILYPDFTDSQGEIEGVSPPYVYKDKIDAMYVMFRIEDTKGRYASKFESIKFPYDVSHGEITTYLLNNELL